MRTLALRSLPLSLLAVIGVAGACVHKVHDAYEPGAEEDGAVVVYDDVTGVPALGDTVEVPFAFVRLGVRYMGSDADCLELRTSADGTVWSAWAAPALVFDEDLAYAGHVDVDGDARFYQHRVVEGHEAPEFLSLEPIGEVGVIPPEAELAGESGGIDATESTDEQGLNVSIVRRASWGARAPRCRSGTGVTHATIHHTVGANDDVTPVSTQMRQIQAFHMFSRGYCDIGYNFLISRDGRIFEGRGYGVLGAHTENANSNNMGISFIGTYTSARPPLEMQIAGAKALRYLHDRAGIPLSRSGSLGVKGHRQRGTTATACPGDKLYSLLGSIVERARTRDFDAGPCETGNFNGEFCDDERHGSRQHIDRLVRELGVDFHCADKEGSPAYCPTTDATRKDAVFVFGKAAGMPTAGHPDAFPDDDGKREAWFNAAKAYGIIMGIDGKAKPDRKLTRSAAAVMLTRMYKLPATNQDFFDDDDDHGKEDAHNRAAAAGLFGGFRDRNGGRRDFKPTEVADRASLAVLAVRAHEAGRVPVWEIPAACLSGPVSGAFCDDDGTAAEARNELLVAAGVSLSWGTLADRTAFQAALPVARGAAIYTLTQAAGIPLDGHPDAFNDDNSSSRQRHFDAAKAFGIINGYNGGTEVRAGEPANRDTLAIILAKMYALPATDVDYFSDDDGTNMEPWHNKVAEAGLFTGFNDGNGGFKFNGTSPATRGQLATVHARAVEAGLVPVWLQP